MLTITEFDNMTNKFTIKECIERLFYTNTDVTVPNSLFFFSPSSTWLTAHQWE